MISERKRAYFKSDKWKAYQKKYRASARWRQHVRKYRSQPEIKQEACDYSRRYFKTLRGRMSKRHRSALERCHFKETDITLDWLCELAILTTHCLCSEEITENNRDLDHRKPIWMGGKHLKRNVRFLCRKCHKARPIDGSDLGIWRISVKGTLPPGGYWRKVRKVA